MAPRPDRKKQLEALREKIWGPAARAASKLFNSADGRLVLEALEKQYFNGRLATTNVHRTYMNLGAREVVRFLRDLRDAGKIDPLT